MRLILPLRLNSWPVRGDGLLGTARIGARAYGRIWRDRGLLCLRHLGERRRRREAGRTGSCKHDAGFHAKRMWARDVWHLTARWLRKLVSHTMVLLLCQRSGLPSLAFAKLIAA